MGITGLIPFLEKATRKVTLKDLKGSTVGIDTYCWLHKGAISCADKLLRGDPTDLHIKFCLKHVNLLLSNGIKPVLVFDGRHLPAKALTEKRRNSSRKEAKEKAKQLLREGKIQEARTYINRGVNITHDMAHELITACRKLNVDCIVAPYEADGQLGYLIRQKIIDYVITEDSDLTLFGCNKVIFKFDLTGQGLLFDADLLYKAMGCKEERFEFRKFEMMAILSGCDYLDSLKGVGLAKACKFVLMTEERDVRRCLKKIPQYLNLKVTVDDEYIDGFLRAMYTFRHMIVFDPRTRKQVHLTDPAEDEVPYCDNAGEKLLDDEVAFQLAIGNINPFTMKTIDHWDPSELNTDKYPSIWGDFGSGAGKATKHSNVIKTISQTTPTTTKRRILKPVEDENDEEHNTSVDIMNKYLDAPNRIGMEELNHNLIAESPPEAKKIRLSNQSDRAIKNPFLKKKDDEDKGDSVGVEKPLHFSLLQQANAIKTENKTSKFRRTTAMDKKISFVSRFFSPTNESKSKCSDDGRIGQIETPFEEQKLDPIEDNKLKPVKSSDRNSSDLGSPEDNKVEIDEGIECPPSSPLNKTDKVSSSSQDPPESQRDSERSATPDSEDLMDCSAFVEAEYSDTPSDSPSQRQRENEQSPVPWTNSASIDLTVQDTMSLSQQSDKENDGATNNHINIPDAIVIDSADDCTPVKVKQQNTKAPAKKNSKSTNATKQKTLLSFFKKK